MKKIEVIIKAEKLEDLKAELNKVGVHGMMITNIMGYGNQKGFTHVYRGETCTVNLLPKIKVETVVCDDLYESVKEAIIRAVRTGSVGDGKIFTYDIHEAIRIRTGEKGKDAI